MSLPPCGVKATIISPCARLRRGHHSAVARFRDCREFSLEVVDCARFVERRSKRRAVVARLFNPGDFDASKLTVKVEDNAKNITLKSFKDLLPRKYTLTHSDVTGELLLSIGPSFNHEQLTDWYTRLMRDEIVAEWRGSEQVSLHVHCHVSGGHVLLAPAALRNSIFEREMPLVLEAIRHGDKDLLAEYPELHASTVWVHFHSSDPAYNRADCWGPLFYAASPIRRVTGKLVPSCISEPFTPLTLVKVQKDPAELCSVMSP